MSEIAAHKPEQGAELENVEPVAVEGLLARVQGLFEQKRRFVTATCLDTGERFDLFYHFDHELELLQLHLSVSKEVEVPSISGIYLAAFLVENEIKELFGVQITGIAIDYHGRLFLTEDSDPTPMAKSAGGRV